MRARVGAGVATGAAAAGGVTGTRPPGAMGTRAPGATCPVRLLPSPSAPCSAATLRTRQAWLSESQPVHPKLGLPGGIAQEHLCAAHADTRFARSNASRRRERARGTHMCIPAQPQHHKLAPTQVLGRLRRGGAHRPASVPGSSWPLSTLLGAGQLRVATPTNTWPLGSSVFTNVSHGTCPCARAGPVSAPAQHRHSCGASLAAPAPIIRVCWREHALRWGGLKRAVVKCSGGCSSRPCSTWSTPTHSFPCAHYSPLQHGQSSPAALCSHCAQRGPAPSGARAGRAPRPPAPASAGAAAA